MQQAVPDATPQPEALYRTVRDEAASQAARSEALDELTALAMGGNAQALMMRGCVAMYGAPGLAVDDGVALEYLEQALERGDPWAPLHLSHIYADQGNQRQAFSLMRKAADDGLPHAQRWLAEMLLNGEGCEADRARAAMYARKAMDGGDDAGTRLYARMLADGQGMAADRERARQLLEALWERLGDAKTAEALGELHAVARDPMELATAATWFQRAAKAGSETADGALRQLQFKRDFADLEYLDLASGRVQFMVVSGTLESVEDRTAVVGLSTSSDSIGNSFQVGGIELSHASTSSHSTVERQYDVRLNLRQANGEPFGITLARASASRIGAKAGDELSGLYASAAGRDRFFPVALMSRRTGQSVFVGDGLPAELAGLVDVRRGWAPIWAVAAVGCLMLTVMSTRHDYLALTLFLATLWCSFRTLRFTWQAVRSRLLRRRYRAHLARVIGLKGRLLLNPA